SPAVFCDSPIFPISRSIASVAMKQAFGAKLVGRSTRSKNWTAANRRSGRAEFGSERGRENSTKSHHDEIWVKSLRATVTPPSRLFGRPTTRRWEKLPCRISALGRDGRNDPIVWCALPSGRLKIGADSVRYGWTSARCPLYPRRRTSHSMCLALETLG